MRIIGDGAAVDGAEGTRRSRPTSDRPLRGEIARAVATLRSDPALLRMKVRQRWSNRRQQVEPPAGSPRPRVASVSHDLGDVVAEARRLSVRRGVAYGDAAFNDAVHAALPEVEWQWVSHKDVDVLAGARLPGPLLGERDAVLVGGNDLKTAYINALRWLDRSGTALPVLWVGQNFEFCGSTLPIPAEVAGADIYLFNHFADFFPIKDPLLVRVTARDQRMTTERLVMMRPQQTVRFELDELLPERIGTSVVEVRTTHPALTGNRHPRWRVWADLFWNDSLTSLHGAHDYGPDRVCESRIALSECPAGSIVVTLPNYDQRLSAIDGDVRWMRGDQPHTFSRKESLAVEQITVPGASDHLSAKPFLGYRYHGYGTSYWFALEDGGASGRPSLCGNHEVTLAQVEYRPALATERRRFLERMEERDFLFWPHALPITDPLSDIEFGFSFESANPQVFDFRVVAFDEEGTVLGRSDLTLAERGYHYADDVVTALGSVLSRRPAMIVVSPDWKRMNVDPQHINAAGNLVARNRHTGDRDVTEFQSCWRNLNATVDGFPHWLHPSKGVIGRTSVVGHVRNRNGLRTAVLVANGSGHLAHTTTATVRVRVHESWGTARAGEVTLPAFTWRLIWLDELIGGLEEHLGPAGYGACLVSSTDADVNCQILTCSSAGAVSLQHLWGY